MKHFHYHVTFKTPTGRQTDTTPWTTPDAAHNTARQYFSPDEKPTIKKADATGTCSGVHNVEHGRDRIIDRPTTTLDPLTKPRISCDLAPQLRRELADQIAKSALTRTPAPTPKDDSTRPPGYRLGCMVVINQATRSTCPNLAMFREHVPNLPPAYICYQHAKSTTYKLDKLPQITHQTDLRIWDANGILRTARTTLRHTQEGGRP